MTLLQVQEGYSEWIGDRARALSREWDFGVWWRVPGCRWTWRVSWIEDTGELYARELAPASDRFVLLAVLPAREDAEAAMAGWEESDLNLALYFPAIPLGDQG